MSAPKGNQFNLKYSLEEVLPVFQELLQRTKNGDFLCIQEIVMNAPYPKRTFYHLTDRFEELQDIKEEMNDAIIAIINRESLHNRYNATSSIWRQKQLGERDQQFQDITTKGDKIEEKTVVKFVRKRK